MTTDYRLSVDTGGTFTDGFVTGGDCWAQVKVDTTPADPTEGFAACVAAAAEAMGESLPAFLARARMVHFSSTIATNTVVQRNGAHVGLIVTAGCERTLYGSPQDAARLAGFIGPEAVRGVAESTAADGSVTAPVDRAGLAAAVRELLELGVHLIVVSFAGAHLNPANENEAKALVEASYPRHYLGAIPLVLSSQLSLHPDDHGRTALAVANAYLHPVLARSLYKADERLRRQKFRYPLLVINTDGSSTRVAKTRAIDTFNSGPSAGVLGAAIVADALRAAHVVTFDVGGTTTDVARVSGGVPPRAARTAFADVSVPHPSIELWSFGLGGGSVIQAGPGGLTVGPRSAGAVPGPACFGLGGTDLTPTDVWLALGYLEPGEFLSGRRRLDPACAAAALRPVADLLGCGTDEAALAALDAVHAALAGHMREWAADRAGQGASGAGASGTGASGTGLTGAGPAGQWLYCYGGGGGLLAAPAASAIGIGQVVVFPQSAVFSAFGGGLLPVAHSYHAAVPDVSDPGAIVRALGAVIDRARRDLRAEGIAAAGDVTAAVTLHDFAGRRAASVLPFPQLAGDPAAAAVALPWAGRGRLAVTVQTAGTRRLGAAAPARTNGRAAADGGAADPGNGGRVPGGGAAPARRVRFADGIADVPVSASLGRPNAPPVTGPAFLAAPDTTVFVPAGWTAEFNALGYGLLRRQVEHG
jgi:N-methylhydantoinase A